MLLRIEGLGPDRVPVQSHVLSIYLGALVLPPLGSTIAWVLARQASGDRTLVWHYVRALKIQLAGCGFVAALQVLVAALLWAASSIEAGPVVVWTVLFGDVAASLGVGVAMVALGPVLLIAYGWDGPVPAQFRREPRGPAASGQTLALTTSMLSSSATPSEQPTRRVGGG